MSSTVRTSVAWALTAVFLTVVCVGDALHFFPGCGHGVWVEDGLLLLGISLPQAQLPAEPQACAKRPEGPDIPIYGYVHDD